jgi:hypothetical protein
MEMSARKFDVPIKRIPVKATEKQQTRIIVMNQKTMTNKNF